MLFIIIGSSKKQTLFTLSVSNTRTIFYNVKQENKVALLTNKFMKHFNQTRPLDTLVQQ